MAITLRGTAAGHRVDDGNLTVTLPAGVVQNDVCYACYMTGRFADANLVTVTTGYTELADLFASDTQCVNFAAYRKRQGSTPDTTIVFSNVVSEVDVEMAGAVMVLIGVDTTTSEDATTTSTTGINSPTPDAPSITTVTANAWVLAMGGSSEADAPTAPSGYSDLISDRASTTPAPANIMIARKQVTSPAAENPGTFGGIVGDVNDSWAAASVAVRPAPSPAVFAGAIPVVFGQAGTLSGGAKFADAEAITFGQAGTLKGGATLAGACPIVFGQAGTLKAGSTLSGATPLQFGQAGNLSAGSGFQGASPIIFGATATLVAGTPGGASFAGSVSITFGATATFTAGGSPAVFAGAASITFDQTASFTAGPAGGGAAFSGTTSLVFGATGTLSAGGGADQPLPPRGAWISDEKVERARRQRFKEQKEERRQLRRQLEEQINPPAILPPALIPGPAIAILPLTVDLAAMRAELAQMQAQAGVIAELKDALAQIAVEEAAADEEAGIVALMMAA